MPMPMSLTPPQPIELGQSLSKVLRMLPPQIRLLDFTSSAPRPPLRRRSVNHGIIVQHFVLSGYDQASGTDDTV